MIDYDKPILDENNNPIKLLECGHHFCIRCVKKFRALKKIGYSIYGLGNKISYGVGDLDSYSVFSNEKQFKNSIKHFIELGVRGITWNNEPDHPVSWAREVINSMNMQDRVKLVSDLHDLNSIRLKDNIIPIPEREMFNAADALIYVSLPIQKITNKLHTVTKPNITLLSYCNEGVVEYNENDIFKRKGLIYEGGINPAGDESTNTSFPYRDLAWIFKSLVEMGNEVHLYCGNMSAFQTLQYIGANLYPPTDYDEMMKGMTKFKYGVLMFNNSKDTEPQVRLTLTNKMQEYLQCGIPSLALWCEESEKYVNKHKIGFTFKTLEEVGDCSQLQNKYLEVMENIKVKRKQLIMEAFVCKLENLYADLLGLGRKAVPKKIQRLHKFEYGEDEMKWVS